MTKEEFKARTKKFALDIVRLYTLLPKNRPNEKFFDQLIRCSSSVRANYRAACRAKSTADFIYKLKIVEEEGDESVFFLELLKELNEAKYTEQIVNLIKEGNEIVAITVSSIKTAQKNRKS